MNDDFRLRVLKALTASLEEITVANGYQHDLASAVFRGRAIFGDSDPLPCLSIMEPPAAPDTSGVPENSTVGKVELDLLVQGFAPDDRLNPTDPAYRLMADVKKRLAEERVRGEGFDILGFGGRVFALDIGQGVVRPPDALVSDTAFFWLAMRLEFSEDYQNPFA